MKYAEGRLGRVFILRLEDGDKLPSAIEDFAAEKAIAVAQVLLLGGIGSGEIVVGPRDSNAMPPDPMRLPVDGAHEVLGVGLLAPEAGGRSVLHMHSSLGRAGRTMTGCLRPGVRTWVVGEAIVQEILGTAANREPDSRTGFSLLQP